MASSAQELYELLYLWDVEGVSRITMAASQHAEGKRHAVNSLVSVTTVAQLQDQCEWFDAVLVKIRAMTFNDEAVKLLTTSMIPRFTSHSNMVGNWIRELQSEPEFDPINGPIKVRTGQYLFDTNKLILTDSTLVCRQILCPSAVSR